MTLLIFGLIAVNVLLLGVLAMALTLKLKFGDLSACYELFAVRDKLVAATVFNGVPREDPWLDSLYNWVNTLLMGSKFLAGPAEGWGRAAFAGVHLAKNPPNRKPDSLPNTEPPEVIKPIIVDLDHALSVHQRRHVGWVVFRSHHEREKRRLQKQMVKELQESLRTHCLAIS